MARLCSDWVDPFLDDVTPQVAARNSSWSACLGPRLRTWFFDVFPALDEGAALICHWII